MIKVFKSEFLSYAKKYDDNYIEKEDYKTEQELKRKLKNQTHLTRDDFIKIGLWKSKRPRKHYESPENSNKFVREITGIAFHSKNEKVTIEALTLIHGCNYPLASVILHFKFPNRYPILDFRALWSLGIKQPKKYTFDFWWNYTRKIRKLSKSLRLDIRTIDKALWWYSKEKQRA
jgi:hypothetical protein